MRRTVRPLLPVREGGTQVQRSTVSCGIHSTQELDSPIVFCLVQDDGVLGIVECECSHNNRHDNSPPPPARAHPSAHYKTLRKYVLKQLFNLLNNNINNLH
jgi:hypothetical protein